MTKVETMKSIAMHDTRVLQEKGRTYGDSWKKRGGVGAFMMLARKWDRLENILSSSVQKYDIFSAVEEQPKGEDGSALAEIRDLRRYLLLVETEMIDREVTEKPTHPDTETESMRVVPRCTPGTPEDGGQHARYEVRHPRDATWAEYEAICDLRIPHGTLAGATWGSIYYKVHSTGRYEMARHLQEEYGK